MNKAVKFYIVLLILLFVGLFAIEFTKQQPINWSKTYNEKQKIPYGTFILYEELDDLFPDSDIKKITVTPFEYFDDYFDWEDSTYSISGNYLLVNEFDAMDEYSAQELMDFTARGNSIFISTSYINRRFQDSLQIKTSNDFYFEGSALLTFTNPKFSGDSISVDKLNNIYFSKIDTLNTTVLGYQHFDKTKRVNFIKVAYGSGYLYFHLQPLLFTNYHLLKKDHYKHAAAALSYLDDDTIYFDSPNKNTQDLGDSPLRFILSQPALRAAWYLGLMSLLLFLIFNAKRKQRIVKVVKPLENTTVAFTKTIGNLYYETKDHNTIIDKKITYFLEYIRRVYYLDTQILDDKFAKSLTLKSGKDLENTKKLMNLIVSLKAKPVCNEADLLALNTAIEDFYTT
jgi:hypothetical protein|uniref:DUF4350 domain-containing protein n=2 Tax=Gelidibacter sp. TaxID=2018083 RepID=UPI004049D211